MDNFPKNFLWGGATSASQYEGGYDAGGRGPAQTDYIRRIEKKDDDKNWAYNVTQAQFEEYRKHEDKYNFPFRRGSDFYHHYKEDIALMGEMGFKVFRMSISWSRLFPKGIEDKPCPEGVEFYHNVFRECRKYHIEPLVTMIHYDIPAYLTETINGWESPKIVDYFVHYSKFIIDEYKDEVKYWLTFNEINMVLNSAYLGGGMFVEASDRTPEACMHQALHHQFIASALTVKYFKEHAPKDKIGNMIARLQTYPYTCKPADVLAAQQQNQFNWFPTDVQIKGYYPKFILNYYRENNIKLDWYPNYKQILQEGTVDFAAISYYHTGVVSTDKDKMEPIGTFVRHLENPYTKISDWGWTIDPTGLRISLNDMNARYNHIPIFIVENGLGAHDNLTKDKQVHDQYRIDYIRDHLKAIKEAISDGCNVIGYTSWGCIDIVSSGDAQMTKRYGYVYVDADDEGNGTYNRYRKDSFYWYKDVIASNGSEI